MRLKPHDQCQEVVVTLRRAVAIGDHLAQVAEARLPRRHRSASTTRQSGQAIIDAAARGKHIGVAATCSCLNTSVVGTTSAPA